MARLALESGRWYAAESALAGRRSRRIGHNTTLERRAADRIAVRYHATDIYTVTADGWAIVDADGWRSVTTMQRVNALLPAPWRISSGTLHRTGRDGWAPIMPFADGLALHVGTTRNAADATDAIGFATDRATVAPMMTAAEVDAVVDAWRTAQAARAAKRDARLLREHPEAGKPHAHKGFDAGNALYGRRPRDCDRCQSESDAARDAQRRELAREHAATVAAMTDTPDAGAWSEAEYTAAGSHVRRETVREYPLVDGSEWRRDYTAAPAESVRVSVSCPWGCPAPDRIGRGY